MGGGARGAGLRTLVRLERRHVRANARFLLFAAGTDIDEERDFLDRAYQLYLLIFMVISRNAPTLLPFAISICFLSLTLQR